MSQAAHAVHYRGRDGGPELEELPSLEAAIERVEQLRNEDAASDVRVFREVPIEVRTYYRVVAAVPSVDAPVEPVAVAQPAADEADDPHLAEVSARSAPSGAMVMSPPPVTVHPEIPSEQDVVEAPVVSDSRRALFSRG